MNESVSVIDSIELVPLGESEVSPLMTKVKIKVFHLGQNRNRSYIDKETAINMAKTLRGTPIVGRYRQEKEDFTDHGNEIIINDKGITTLSMTKPYGFVDLNAKVWFEDYIDTDEFGNQLQHTYLVTEGLVWTEQYEELRQTVGQEQGRPQSMELDEKTLKGNWAKVDNSLVELFIINDAIITKLCALGEDVEPCFLGASIAPIANFSNEENDFINSLLNMKKQFSLILNNNSEGGLSMDNTIEAAVVEETPVAVVEETPVVDEPAVEEVIETPTEEISEVADKIDETIAAENEDIVEEFVKKDSEEEKPKSEDESDKEEKSEDEKKKEEVTENACDKKKYELLESEYEELKAKYALLEEENKVLAKFKADTEEVQKDELIASFDMLTEEDKRDVITNKSSYSLDDIKAKLSIICVDKRVNFNSNTVAEESAPVTYNLSASEATVLPAWLQAVENCRKN